MCVKCRDGDVKKICAPGGGGGGGWQKVELRVGGDRESKNEHDKRRRFVRGRVIVLFVYCIDCSNTSLSVTVYSSSIFTVGCSPKKKHTEGHLPLRCWP